jgi:hypothetical protein
LLLRDWLDWLGAKMEQVGQTRRRQQLEWLNAKRTKQTGQTRKRGQLRQAGAKAAKQAEWTQWTH